MELKPAGGEVADDARSGGVRSAKLAGMSTARRPRGGYYPGDWVRPRPNPGGWTPIADTQEIHTGNRSVNRAGAFELYDAPVGVRLRVEQAARCTCCTTKTAPSSWPAAKTATAGGRWRR